MNRQELLMYLENIRNLEVIKYYGLSKCNRYQNKISELQEKIKLNNKTYSIEAETIRAMILSFVLIIGAFILHICGNCYQQNGSYIGFIAYCLRFFLPIVCLFWAILIPIINGAVSDIFDTISLRRSAKKHNKKVESIMPQTTAEIKEIASAMAKVQNEIYEVNKLLAEAYSFNIIPSQHRNIESAIYIYDYISTSQQSLESALVHSHMEQGIRQISAKLDTIIYRNIEIVKMLKYNIIGNSAVISRLNDISNNVRLISHFDNVRGYYSNCSLI